MYFNVFFYFILVFLFFLVFLYFNVFFVVVLLARITKLSSNLLSNWLAEYNILT